jgi:molybdopterin biosynthesis enzyme MoaB
MAKATDETPQALQIAVLTVSDTRGEEDDTSGHYPTSRS